MKIQDDNIWWVVLTSYNVFVSLYCAPSIPPWPWVGGRRRWCNHGGTAGVGHWAALLVLVLQPRSPGYPSLVLVLQPRSPGYPPLVLVLQPRSLSYPSLVLVLQHRWTSYPSLVLVLQLPYTMCSYLRQSNSQQKFNYFGPNFEACLMHSLLVLCCHQPLAT